MPVEGQPKVRRRRRKSPNSVILGVLFLLTLVASGFLVASNSVEGLRMGIVVALWAAILGALAVAKYRKEAEAERTRIRDMRLVYELQLSREIAARRRHEMTVESRIRRELESETQADTAEQVAALRHELASMRGHIEYAISSTVDRRRELTATPHSDVGELAVPDRSVADSSVTDTSVTHSDSSRTQQERDHDVVDAEFETEYQPSTHAETR